MELVERVKSAIKTRSNFSLSYEGVLTGDFGDFIPICVKEMVPTDSFTVQSQAFFRLAPLATPTFGKIHGYINSFFVPYRILMPRNEYEDSMTGGIDGDYPETFPFITRRALMDIYARIYDIGDTSELKRFKKIFSYLGLGDFISELMSAYQAQEAVLSDDELEAWMKTMDTVDGSISLLPFLALFRIFYDYYAPMNIEEDFGLRETFTHQYKGLISVANNSSSGDIERLSLAFMLLVTCYNKDYFTMAMTRPQRGAASVADVDYADGNMSKTTISGAAWLDGDSSLSTDSITDSDGGSLYLDAFNPETSALGGISPTNNIDLGTVSGQMVFANEGQQLNLSKLGDNPLGRLKVQTLRFAEKIQSFLETNNIAGGRFFEQMLARFGVKFPAKVLQRSEYLGGKDFWVQISDVTATADTTATSFGANLGETAGKGIALGKDSISYSSDDYGFFISILHFVLETMGLVDGLDRMWTRHTKFDYWQPEMEETGMQPVFNRELNRHHFTFPLSSDSNPDGVFGYNPRFAEYKVANPILGGDFVLSGGVYSPQVLSSMNLFRRVGTEDVIDGDIETPILSRDFVSLLGYDAGHNNFDRIFQNTGTTFDHFFINTQIAIGANRPMIGYAEGGLEFAHEDKGNKSVSMAYGGMRL